MARGLRIDMPWHVDGPSQSSKGNIMRTIYQYELEPHGIAYTLIRLPLGSVVRSVGVQEHVITAWIERPIQWDEEEEHRFYVVGTGEEFPSWEHAHVNFVGTVFQGPYVWHIYHGW